MRLLLMTALLVGCTGDDPGVHTDTDATGDGVIRATAGTTCDLDARVGRVMVESWGGDTAAFTAKLWDARDPWIDEPVLTNADCAHHSFDVNSCGPCDVGTVCSASGSCVPERRAITDYTLVVEQSGSSESFTPTDEGFAYGEVALDAPVGFEIRWGDKVIRMEPASVPSADIAASVSATGDYDTPGTLTVTWTDPGDDSHIATTIPINHHAGGPTFTQCAADASAEGFVAEPDMVNPLAVSTGLEFQGLDHQQVASAQVAEGCIEFVLGRRVHTDVNFAGQ